MRWRAPIGLLFVFLCLAGCNTIQGMGKDIRKTGEKIEDVATKSP